MDDVRTCPTCGTRVDDEARFCAIDGTPLGRYEAPPAPPHVTTIAGRYRLGRVVGMGGSGIVYEAFAEPVGQRVALKLVRPANVADATPRLLAEARILMQVAHPNISTVRDAGTLPDGGAYLVLDWVEGHALNQVLAERGGRLDPLDAVDVAIAVAGALEAAHAKGVLHRDVKPNNVLVRGEGGVYRFDESKLVDFGVHGLLTERAPGGGMTTQAGMIVGSPSYMAPEQLLGARNTPATDLFGLGVVLFEMLYGRSPFGEDMQSILFVQLRGAVELPEEPTLPSGLAPLLVGLLEREPTARPQAAHDVLATLRGIRAGMEFQRGTTRPIAIGPPATFWSAAPVTAPAHPSLLAAVGGSRVVLTALGVLVLGAAILLLFVPPRGSAPGPAAAPSVSRSAAQVMLVLAVGGLVFTLVSSLIARRRAQLAAQTADLSHSVDSALFGQMPLDRGGISQTIVTTVEAIIHRCNSLDERLIGQTIVAIAHEYASDRSTPDSRMEALVQIPQQIEKLSAKIAARSTPWYVRHEKLLAAAASGTAIIGGLAKTALDILAATGGKGPAPH